MRILKDEYGLGTPLKRHKVRPEVNADGLEYSFYVIESAQAEDPGIAIAVSECLFNLRAALDHLVYQLHVRRYRGKVPRDAAEAASWPIITYTPPLTGNRRTRDTKTWHEIRRLSEEQRTAIQWLQPYIRRDDHLKEVRARLGALVILQNIDKHRRLHVHERRAYPVPREVDYPPGTMPRQTVFTRRLEAGTKVEQWTFTEPPTEMRVHHDVFSEVSVDEEISDKRFFVYDLLHWLTGDVAQILRDFGRRFWGEYETAWH